LLGIYMFNLDNCVNHCSPDAKCYNPGVIGTNYESSRIMIVLNRSDSRATQAIDEGEGLFKSIPPENSYDRALRMSNTGKLLNWLYSYCGLTDDDIYVTNAFKCLLPKDREPKKKEYAACVDLLKEQIIAAKPSKIMVFGQRPYRHLFNRDDNGEKFLEFETYNGIPVLALNHPRKLYDMQTHHRQRYFKIIRKFIQS